MAVATLQRQSSKRRRPFGSQQWRGAVVVLELVGGFKVALVASATSVTLAAGGLTFQGAAGDAAAILAALVSVVTLTRMFLKWLRDRRIRANPGPPPVMPEAPPKLPVTRMSREDYARALAAWEQHRVDMEHYHVQLAAYHKAREK